MADVVSPEENGGRSVSWATLTGWMLKSLDDRLSRSARIGPVTRPVFGLAYAAVNGVGRLLDMVERRYERGPYALPMDLMLTARRPRDE